MSLFHNPNITTQGITLCLDAANNKSYSGSGTAWNDISSKVNNGTLVNGPTFNSSNGGSIVFDGINDYVTMPSTGNLLSFGTNDFTISYWILLNTVATDFAILTTYNAYNSNYASYFYTGYRTSVGKITLLNSQGTVFVVSASLGASVWANIAFTKTGTTFNCYKNGTLSETGTDSFNNYSGSGRSPLLGGGLSDWGYMNGSLSNIQVYNRFLSATEIAQNFNAYRGRFGV